MKLALRPEETPDFQLIYDINQAAFGRPDEARLVDQLRADGDLILSLVAEADGRLVGHIAMSRMFVSTPDYDVPALALAPVAVHPRFQKRGVGSALNREAIRMAREKGESMILVLGHKEYYPRFGFSTESAKNIQHPFPKDSFMALELRAGVLDGVAGRVKYPGAFGLGAEHTCE